MFTASALHPQLVVPLSQLSAVWNTVRSSAHNITLGRHYRSTTPSSITVTASTEIPASTNDVTESLQTVLNDLGLNELSKDVKVEALVPGVSPSVKHPVTNWKQSYTLSDNFFLNKHGFTETQLQESKFGEPLSKSFKITMPNMSNMYGFRRANKPVYQQVRGFKTKHTSTSGLGKYKVTSDDSFPALKNLRESVLGRISTGTQRKSSIKEGEQFGNLVKSYDHAPETQDKLKVAFAEGYAANVKKDTGGEQTSWGRRFAKFAWYGVLLYLLVQLFQGYTALGGNMKINVLKGERYEINPEDITITFDDVKGADEAKQELKDIVQFLQDPEKFKVLGAKLPKGVLLVGAPGIGKTLLARAVAGEAGVPFFHASGSEFDEIFVGTGAKRVRQLFDAAKSRAPCVIFIDEIDTVGAKRTSSQIHPYANQTINQLLSEMDGFQQNEGVIVLGATNRRDNLDSALLRPGRFDVEVRVYAPDLKGRKEILELYMTKVKVGPDVDIDSLARGTTGCTGADLENMVNQAALKAAMDGAPVVTHLHMEFAKDKVLMGPAKKTRITDEDTNLCTAYHEAGHTLVAYFTKGSIPLHKVTIIPRGMSLGHTSFIPEKEQYNYTRQQLLAQMDVAMGGRVAEEVVFGKDQITTGASSDFSTATAIATAMVKKYGMSEKVGVRVFSDDDVDSGLNFVRVNDVSPATAEVVDSEIKRLLNESYERATKIITQHNKAHKALSQALMKYETLDAEDIKALIEGKKPLKCESSETVFDSNEIRIPKALSPKATVPTEGMKNPM